MALADGADPADRSRDRIASAEYRLARRHLIEDTVVVGASIAKTFHTLEKIEIVNHHLEIEIRVRPFSWPLFNFREARSIRAKPELVIILREI